MSETITTNANVFVVTDSFLRLLTALRFPLPENVEQATHLLVFEDYQAQFIEIPEDEAPLVIENIVMVRWNDNVPIIHNK